MGNKCVLPFIGQDYQSDSPCCLLENYNKESLQKLLDDHNSGVKSEFCSQCWDQESSGGSSKRLLYNDLYSRHLSLSQRSVKISVIPVGNLCNLHCVMCHTGASTGWWKKHASMYPEKNTGKKKELILDIDHAQIDAMEDLEHVEFIGGETLKSFSLWKLLSRMKKTTGFSLQTNGTVELNDSQTQLLKSFDKCNICFSLDGYGKIFEYIRQPAMWDQVRENVKRYINDFGRDRLSIYLTVSNLNILYMDKIMFELYKLLPTKIELNFVVDPVRFHYKNLPEQVGKIVEQRNPGFFMNRKIEWIGTEKSISDMKQNLEAQDRFTGLSKENYLPELFDLI